jgi:hypothetical protein
MPDMGIEPPVENEEQLEEFFDEQYKDPSELIIDRVLEESLRQQKFPYKRLALFRNLLITNRAFARVELVDGFPTVRVVNPAHFIFDTSATDDFLSDSTFYGEVRYMSMADAAHQYGLTRKELEAAYKTLNDPNIDASLLQVQIQRSLNGADFPLFKQEAGEMRVLVANVFWEDVKYYNHKKSVDQFGNEHFKRVPDNKKGKDIVKQPLKIWRKCTMIGGSLVKEWGEMENGIRSIDDLRAVKRPYICLIPNFLNGRGVGKVEQLRGLQDFKDLVMFNLQATLARAGAKGFVYDVAQTPRGWDVHTVIKYLKTVGIAFIDSKKDGLASQFNQFGPVDMSLQASVSKYIEISAMIDREMDAVSGINEARQGLVQGSSQAVGVTQSALAQSSLSTELIFELFGQFLNEILDQTVGLIRTTWENKEMYAGVLAELGVTEEEIEQVEIDDFQAYAESLPPALEDKQTFMGILQAAIASQSIDMEDVFMLLLERDTERAIHKAVHAIKKKRHQAEQAQKAQMQAEQQMQQQQMEAQGQMAQQNNEFQLQKQQMGKEADERRQAVSDAAKLKQLIVDAQLKMAQNLPNQ